METEIQRHQEITEVHPTPFKEPTPLKQAWWEETNIHDFYEAASYCSADEWLFIQYSSDLPSNAELKNSSIAPTNKITK